MLWTYIQSCVVSDLWQFGSVCLRRPSVTEYKHWEKPIKEVDRGEREQEEREGRAQKESAQQTNIIWPYDDSP